MVKGTKITYTNDINLLDIYRKYGGAKEVELSIVQSKGKDIIVLLDDKMRIVKPVYDYLKYLRLKDRAVNTLKANGTDLKIYWNFLNIKGYEYNEVTPDIIGEFVEFLREPNDTYSVATLYVESQRTARTVNRILSNDQEAQ